jgi:uncharacterized protein (TIGR03083 family)
LCNLPQPRGLVNHKTTRIACLVMNETRSIFLEAFEAAGQLLSRPELEAAWDGPSALPYFSLRGLAGHTVRAGARVLVYLDEPAPEAATPIPAPAYFRDALRSMDETDNLRVRSDGEATAQDGWAQLVAEHHRLSERLRSRLETEPADRILKVFGENVMRLDDYLATRIVELVVHSEDLAATLGFADFGAPERAIDVAINHLVDVARLTHGDRQVLMALARRERDRNDALRVF